MQEQAFLLFSQGRSAAFKHSGQHRTRLECGRGSAKTCVGVSQTIQTFGSERTLLQLLGLVYQPVSVNEGAAFIRSSDEYSAPTEIVQIFGKLQGIVSLYKVHRAGKFQLKLMGKCSRGCLEA